MENSTQKDQYKLLQCPFIFTLWGSYFHLEQFACSSWWTLDVPIQFGAASHYSFWRLSVRIRWPKFCGSVPFKWNSNAFGWKLGTNTYIFKGISLPIHLPWDRTAFTACMVLCSWLFSGNCHFRHAWHVLVSLVLLF